jgi:ABC-type uncharacterized transport system involved in gliding motility auxiliary subunit
VRTLDAWLRIVLGTVALIGLFGVGLAILYRYDLRLDLSAEQRYSLSPYARSLLAGLTQDIELVAFLRGQNPRNPYIRDLLRRVDNASPRVRWEEVDVNRSPAKAHRYRVTSYGAVVVRSGGRERVLINPREDNLMWAILQVTREEPKTVYFVSGHGERTPAGQDRLEGFSAAGARVQGELYSVRIVSLPEAAAVPEDATVLIVAGPRGPVAPTELEKLDMYLRGGGRMLVMLDALEEAHLGPYLARYGIVVGSETVVDPDNRMFGGEFVSIRVPTDATDHPIARGLGAPPVFSLARPIEPAGPETLAPGTLVLPVLRTGPGSWATSDADVLTRGVPRFDDARDRRGPITVGVEVRLPHGDGGGEGRLVVIGNAQFASNFFLEREGNADLLLNTVNWLAGEESLIAPRQPHKAPGTEQLLVLGEQGTRIFWVAVVVEPALFLLAGLVQFWRQRLAR